MYSFSQKSLDKLNNPKLHPKLRQLFLEAIKTSPIDFTIVETIRTKELQIKYVKEGKSKTLKSRHIPDTNKSKLGEAVDIAPIVNGKTDYTKCDTVAKHIKQVAKKLGIAITWGGDFKNFSDKPHFELK